MIDGEVKKFKRSSLYNLVDDFQKIERHDQDKFRTYIVGDNEYPSVTSVLGIEENEPLQKWKDAVGEEEALRVSRRATRRGTIVHDMCENYINGTFEVDRYNPLNYMLFNPIKKVLDEHVDDVFAVEKQMFSHKLKTAGTLDLGANFDRIRSVIDYKTSTRYKNEDEITNYFIQLSIYAYMLNEHFDAGIKQVVVIMTVDGGDCLVFTKGADEYLKKFFKPRLRFKEVYGI